MASEKTAAKVRLAQGRLSAFLKDETSFMDASAIGASVQRMGYKDAGDMARRAPRRFLEFVDAICVDMEDDPDYSGNPETGQVWA